MQSREASRTLITIALCLAVVSTTVAITLATGVNASSNAQPADKMAVAGSGVDIGAPGETLTILSGDMKTSSPEDAVITVSLECDILTQVTTVGNDNSQASSQIKVWVELDGAPIAVAGDDASDSGKAVFCDRVHRQTTSLFDDEDATIESFIQTRTANAFQWITLNMGSGDHHFDVKASLTTDGTTENALANGVIGKRTLVVEPVKLANNAMI